MANSKLGEMMKRIAVMKVGDKFAIKSKSERTCAIQAADALRSMGKITFEFITKKDDEGNVNGHAI